MVARLQHPISQASEAAWRESHTHTVALPDNSQHDLLQERSQQESLQGPIALSSYSVAQLPPQVEPFHPARIPIASAGDHMPPVFPEQSKAGFNEVLKLIQRKNSFRAVASQKTKAPVLVCIERIRQAKAVSGLSDQEIADLAGIKSRHTVAKVLRVDESVGLYNFCAVMNVLGLDIAELFPMRKRAPAPAVKWPRGYHNSLESTQRKHTVLARGREGFYARRGRKRRLG